MLGTISQSMDGSTRIIKWATMVFVVLVEEGLGDVVKQLGGVVEQLRDVLELFLFYMKARCPLGFLEQSFSQPKPQMSPLHTPFMPQ